MKINMSDKIKKFSEREKRAFLSHKNPLSVLKNRTNFFDRLITSMIEEITGSAGWENFFIAAVGGYGRKELYPQSDIDMVIISRKADEGLLKEIYDRLIVRLLDAKIEVGYAFREIDELPEDLQRDITIVTSYLNARYLCGNYRLYEYWLENTIYPFFKKMRVKYFNLKLDEYNKRLLKYNQTPYILEPNIKEGIGGLRDFHYMNWLSRVTIGQGDFNGLFYLNIIDGRELKELQNAYSFLSRVRCYIHMFRYIKKETLTFELQEEVAHFLNYKDREDASSVEAFMQDFYRHTHNVYLISRKVFHSLDVFLKKERYLVKKEIDSGIFLEGYLGGEISITPQRTQKNVRSLFKVFLYSKNLQKPISFKTLNIIKNLARRFVILQWDEELRNILFQLFTPKNSNDFNVIMDMYYSDFLKIIFPEFDKIYHKMQFDAYHIYTIDIHSLYSVKSLLSFYEENRDDIRRKIRKPHILLLSALLHDIGKGLGKDHAEKGALIAEQICKRLELNVEDTEIIVFLVKKHLLLSKIAQRRDISDFAYLRKVFEEEIKSKEIFEYLYFITLADLMSVGEGVFSKWKESLFKRLYINFEKILDTWKKDYVYIEDFGRQRRKELISFLEDKNKHMLIPYVKHLPVNYLLTNEFQVIEKHLEIDREFDISGREYVVNINPDFKNKVTEIIIASKDRKGLFYKLAGIITYTGFNILSASINTRENGSVLDVFYVDLGKREYEFDEYLNEKFMETIDEVLARGKDIDEKIMKKIKGFHKKNIFKEKDEIYFDNTSSEGFTIIDVFTKDHIGLLYEITKKLYQLNLDIYFSKINTLGERAIDVFYVKRNGRKIVDEQDLEAIRTALLKVLA